MPNINQEQLSHIISQVTAQVLKEVEGVNGSGLAGNSRPFDVSDLRTHVGALGKLGENAWEVSYKTTGGAVIQQRQETR